MLVSDSVHCVRCLNVGFYSHVNKNYNYDVDLLKMSRVMLETCKGFQ
jgi:hypothetical protein